MKPHRVISEFLFANERIKPQECSIWTPPDEATANKLIGAGCLRPLPEGDGEGERVQLAALPVREILPLVQASEDLDELAAWLEEESARTPDENGRGGPRKTVLEALDARVDALTAPPEGDGEGEGEAPTTDGRGEAPPDEAAGDAEGEGTADAADAGGEEDA